MQKASPSYGFHDAEVVEFSSSGDLIRLVLVCFTETDNITVPVSMMFSEVSALKISGDNDGFVGKVTNEGSVINLTMQDNKAEFAIEWVDHRNEKNSKTILYQFAFRQVVTNVGH